MNDKNVMLGEITRLVDEIIDGSLSLVHAEIRVDYNGFNGNEVTMYVRTKRAPESVSAKKSPIGDFEDFYTKLP